MRDWLGIYWPADEYAFIKLTSQNKLAAFYEEAARLLPGLIKQSWPLLEGAVREAITLNAALISQPFVRDDITVATRVVGEQEGRLSLRQQERLG